MNQVPCVVMRDSSSDDENNSNDVASIPQLGGDLGMDGPRHEDDHEVADVDSEGMIAATDALQLDERNEDRQQHLGPAGLEQRLAQFHDRVFEECRLKSVTGEIAKLEKLARTPAGPCGQNVSIAILVSRTLNGVGALRNLSKIGSSLDCINQSGRTPLMEAALWGCLANVTYLLQQGVDYIGRDRNGMQAFDLAADTVRNEAERTERRRGGIFTEHSDAARRRRHIRELLTPIGLSCANHYRPEFCIETGQLLRQGSRWEACLLSTAVSTGTSFKVSPQSVRHVRPRIDASLGIRYEWS